MRRRRKGVGGRGASDSDKFMLKMVAILMRVSSLHYHSLTSRKPYQLAGHKTPKLNQALEAVPGRNSASHKHSGSATSYKIFCFDSQ